MSLTNAISGVIAIGGFHTFGSHSDVSKILSVIATFAASINIFGGFIITHRMLSMFRRKGNRNTSLSAPTVAFFSLATLAVLAAFLLAFYSFDRQEMATIQLLYLLAAVLFIIALSSLQEAALARCVDIYFHCTVGPKVVQSDKLSCFV